jgi:uncharacterized Rmd1/YagE family protein
VFPVLNELSTMPQAARTDDSPERSLIDNRYFRGHAVLIGHRLDFSSWKTAKAGIAVQPLGLELQTRGRTTRAKKRLLNHIGEALLSEHRMVGRAEVRDKPEILWGNSHLEPLYLRLIEELEINDRHSILERKISLTSRTATTALELLQTQRGHRLEWYIVILIVIEVLPGIYELFIK